MVVGEHQLIAFDSRHTQRHRVRGMFDSVGRHDDLVAFALTFSEQTCPIAFRQIGRTKGVFALRPTSHRTGASTSPLPFRNERRRHLHAAGRDTGGVAGDLFVAPRLPILDTAWP